MATNVTEGRQLMRILGHGRSYLELSSKTLYESDFVESIVRFSDEIFPGFACGKFAPLIESPYGGSRPDLILVDRGYRTWCVVEVELEHHSLSGHVEPQVQCLANGAYDIPRVADAAVRALPHLNPQAVRQLVLTAQPEIVVVVPEASQRWRESLGALGAIITVLQVFEDDRGNRLYRVNGAQPTAPPPEVLGSAQRIRGVPSGLEIVGLPLEPETDLVDFLFESELTRWRVMRPGGRLYLLPLGRCPLPEGRTDTYSVIEAADGTWELERDGNQRRNHT